MQTISIHKIQSILLLFIAITIIPNCVAQTGAPSLAPTPIVEEGEEADKPWYQELDVLKYIAIAALLVLICCCLALIIFVRRQVRKTEQGTEIQQYIRKKKESADISQGASNGSHPNGHMLAASQSGNRIPKLSYDQSNTFQSQTQTNTINNGYAHNGNGSNINLYGHDGHNGHTGHGSNGNVMIPGPQGFPTNAVSMDSTPGHLIGDGVDDQEDIKKEVYLIKINEQKRMKDKFLAADHKEKIEDFNEEDDEFKDDLKYKIDRLQSEENRMFHEMEKEQARQMQPQHMQGQYQ